MDTEFLFEVTKMFWNRRWWQLSNSINILNTTELLQKVGVFLMSELYLTFLKTPTDPALPTSSLCSFNICRQVDLMCIWDKTPGSLLPLHPWSKLVPGLFSLPLSTPSSSPPFFKVQIKSHFFHNTFHPYLTSLPKDRLGFFISCLLSNNAEFSWIIYKWL